MARARPMQETKTPDHYQGMSDPLVIRKDNDIVTVEGDVNYYQTDAQVTTVTVRNRPYTFTAIKVDADSNVPLEGVKFNLHRQVTVDGVTTIDLIPMIGYTGLTTDEDGIIPKINETLPAGTYELRENQGLDGYDPLPYIDFTVSPIGEITLLTQFDLVTLTKEGTEQISYVLTVGNSERKKASIWKTDQGYNTLTGASFALYKAADCDETGRPNEGAVPVKAGNVGTNGILNLGDLSIGKYYLIETHAPDGYIPAEKPIEITILSGLSGKDAVKAMQAGRESDTYDKNDAYFVNGQDEKTIQIRVWNNPGVVLPSTGGTGRMSYYLTGSLLMIISAILLKKKNK